MIVALRWVSIFVGMAFFPIFVYGLLRKYHVTRLPFSIMVPIYLGLYIFLAGVFTSTSPLNNTITPNLMISFLFFIVGIPAAYLMYPLLKHIVEK